MLDWFGVSLDSGWLSTDFLDPFLSDQPIKQGLHLRVITNQEIVGTIFSLDAFLIMMDFADEVFAYCNMF